MFDVSTLTSIEAVENAVFELQSTQPTLAAF
jgi:hypothetical protein